MRACRSRTRLHVGPNDIFVVRVAGNGLGADVLGSLKYASRSLGHEFEPIVVLVTAVVAQSRLRVEVFLNPAEYLALATNRAARGILDQLIIVVHAAARRLMTTFGEGVTGRPGYRNALVEMSVATNAALTAYTI